MHEDKFHSGWRPAGHSKRSTLYEKPMEKKCNHETILEIYNVVEDVMMTQCKDCGKRLDVRGKRLDK